MTETPCIAVAVRTLVETLRTGDLSSGFRAGPRAAEGIRWHRQLQAAEEAAAHPGREYLAELPVSQVVDCPGIRLEIGGRIDGVIREPDGVTIDEIKTVTGDPALIGEDDHPLHWAQARCYGYLYAAENGLERIAVNITYCQVDTGATRRFRRDYTAEELRVFFEDLACRYASWALILFQWSETRDRSIAALPFPFGSYRAGQRELAVEVYSAARRRGRLFIQAPTGIGKTSATLFPAVKSMGEGHAAKIFYLTAKTVTRALAAAAVDRMREGGLRLKSVEITARDKICFFPDAECVPEQCACAKGYYDRVREATAELFGQDSFSRQAIEETARRHQVCPFEFSLDMSLWSDVILCDYNYVFDPAVYLRRFFPEPGEAAGNPPYVFLVDEAHNLVDRAREMFSAELTKDGFAALKRELAPRRTPRKALPPPVRRLDQSLAKINTWMTAARKTCSVAEGQALYAADRKPPEELYPLLRRFAELAEKILVTPAEHAFRARLLELYFETRAFLRTAEYFDERFVQVLKRTGDELAVMLRCLDPSALLGEALKRGSAAVFFSATLSPMEYFVRVLGGGDEARTRLLPSPFPREHLRVFVDDAVSTRYKNRHQSYDRIAEAVAAAVGVRTGNYLVYFPSYRYLNEVADRFRALNPGTAVISQRESMTEAEREEFLCRFTDRVETTLVGFAVMGGVFGEGIDLVGERLSGVIIVGVGLPQVGFERDLIKDYYEETIGEGFEYAYVYPGMNKVLQAAGRVIRTATDRGIAVLVDDRFSTARYRQLMPAEWKPLVRAADRETLEKRVADFWNNPGA